MNHRLVLVLFFSITFAFVAHAEVRYPVSALGNCKDKDACAVYCDLPVNQAACTAYAASNMVAQAPNNSPGVSPLPADKKLSDTIAKFGGPDGACNDLAGCQDYCAQPGHETECIEYAKKKGLIDPKDADSQLNLIRNAAPRPSRSLTKPGGCRDKATCRSYCTDSSHRDECEAYALANGITPQTISDYQAEAVPITPPADVLPPTPPPTGNERRPTPTSKNDEQGASLLRLFSRMKSYLFKR